MKMTKGIIDAIRNNDSKPVENIQSEFTAHDFHDIVNRISEGKPTKEKPFYFLKGNMRFEGKEVGAVAIKNDSEFLYVKTSDDMEFKKIDHEEFHNNNIKYID